MTTWYARRARSFARPGSERARALARQIRILAAADELPRPPDYQAELRPVGKAWIAKVSDRNLWLWYRYDADEVMVVAVTTQPPVPDS